MLIFSQIFYKLSFNTLIFYTLGLAIENLAFMNYFHKSVWIYLLFLYQDLVIYSKYFITSIGNIL